MLKAIVGKRLHRRGTVAQPWYQYLRARRLTLVLASLTVIVLILSATGSLRHAIDTGGFHIFSAQFLENIPRRLSGPGRFRFFLQPLIAVILGIRSGRSDLREGKPPYLYGVLFHPGLRGDLLRSALATVINLVLMGILMDAVFQWVIFGVSHPGAALVLGPVLILVPYSISRALTNRIGGKGKTLKRHPNSVN